MKLGLNSMYGKRAQHVGGGKYRCMVAAGLITSMCRAMILQAIARAKDPWSILSVATDGILSTERLDLPAPIDLGTGKEVDPSTGKLYKALGSWEEKVYPKGVFLIRPGLRFSLDDVATIKETAARGLGVRVLHANRRKVLDQWDRFPGQEVSIQQPDMFHGAKQSIRSVMRPGTIDVYGIGTTDFKRHGLYGKWSTPESRRVGYEADPKRESTESLSWPGKGPRESFKLIPWQAPPGGLPSMPYKHGMFEDLKEDVEWLGEEVEAIIGGD